jgi:hypothetical protein
MTVLAVKIITDGVIVNLVKFIKESLTDIEEAIIFMVVDMVVVITNIKA